MEKIEEKDGIVIDKIISWYDMKKNKELFATVWYTQTSFDGEKRQFEINIDNNEIITYYIKRLHRQPKSNGKHIIEDVRNYQRRNQQPQEILSLGINKSSNNYQSKSTNERKPSIKIISLIVATVIAVVSGGYCLSSFSNKKKKAESITNKIEQTGYNVLSQRELQDLVSYIEEENNDNRYQKEEIDLNDRILKGLVQDKIESNMITKAQGLFKNCFIKSNRYGYDKSEVYKYFMYMSSLFMNGDTFGSGSVGDAIIADEMKDTYEDAEKYVEAAKGLVGGKQISVNRVMFSATGSEAAALKRMPLLVQKILMEQFLTICKNVEINLNPHDRPMWWNIGKESYTEERVLQEIETRSEIIKQELEENRLKSVNSSKKH